jgi:hypothetical protein
MSLSSEENEIIDHLQEIARLRGALVMIKYMAELNLADALREILALAKETLGTE